MDEKKMKKERGGIPIYELQCLKDYEKKEFKFKIKRNSPYWFGGGRKRGRKRKRICYICLNPIRQRQKVVHIEERHTKEIKEVHSTCLKRIKNYREMLVIYYS